MNFNRRKKPLIREYLESRIEEDLSKINHNVDLVTGTYFWMKNLHNRKFPKKFKKNVMVPAKKIHDPRNNMEAIYMNDFIDSISRTYQRNLVKKLSGDFPLYSSLVPPTRVFDEKTAMKYVASFDSNSSIDHLILNFPYNSGDQESKFDRNLNLF